MTTLKEMMDEFEYYTTKAPPETNALNFNMSITGNYYQAMKALKEAVEVMTSIQMPSLGGIPSQVNNLVLPPQSVLHPKAQDWLKKWGF